MKSTLVAVISSALLGCAMPDKFLPLKLCSECEHMKQNPDGGHCYMFEKEPEGNYCGQFKVDSDSPYAITE
jgi:hypothetical protein